MTESETLDGSSSSKAPQQTGRNESCPCKSGKKYKRCCGINAAPKVTPPKQGASNAMGNSMGNPMSKMMSGMAGSPSGGGFDPSMMENFDPQMLMQFTQAIQKLPKGQLQRFQALMQKAMNGRDISSEAAEFERTLPPEFQEMMRSFSGMALQQMGDENSQNLQEMAAEAASYQTPLQASLPAPSVQMTEEEARKLVAQAAKEGKISSDQAQALLEKGPETAPESFKDSKLGKFWKNLSGKNSS